MSSLQKPTWTCKTEVDQKIYTEQVVFRFFSPKIKFSHYHPTKGGKGGIDFSISTIEDQLYL